MGLRKKGSDPISQFGRAFGNIITDVAPTILNTLVPGTGGLLSSAMSSAKATSQPPVKMSDKTRPTSGIMTTPTGYRHGGMLKAYNAPTHEDGGQMIDRNANPTNNPNKAVGEIEKRETSWNGYVFSDTLGEGKKTYAQMSKEIVNRYKGKRDNLSKKTMERELKLLVQKNEAARLEKEQMEMQQQQNQFTEEQLATLQNPQSPSKEELDRLFAQQQQGQPSQEQMMQMMQQQQMQQQGQPSQEELMMMQQQQGGMPQEAGQYRWGGNMDFPMYRYQDGGGLNDIDSKMMGQQQIVTNTALPKDSVPTNVYQQAVKGFFEAVAPQVYNKDCNCYEPQQNQFQQHSYANYPFQNVANIPQEMNMQQATMKQPKMPKQPNVSTIDLQNTNQQFDSKGGIVYQNGGMLEVPEAPLDEYKKGGWIQKVTKSIKKRGTEGVCTGDKYGGPTCPPGSKRYNLAKTFRTMAKKEDGGYIDSFPDLNLANYEEGGMIERADGSYSQRGLWDNIRDNIGSGKKPTKAMLEQEAKIKAQEEYRDGGYVVKRSNDRKGKTHVVIGPDGTKKYFGDPDLKNNPSEKAKDAFYARHKKNLEGNPYFRAYARATWRDGGMIPQYPDGGGLDEIVNAAVPIPQFDTNLNFTPSFVGSPYGYTNKNIAAFVNKAKEIRNKYKTFQGEDFSIPYGDQRDNRAFEDFETLKALYAKLPPNAKKEQGNTFSVIEKSLYGNITDRTKPGYLIQKEISNTGIDKFYPRIPKKIIPQQQSQNSPIEIPLSYPIDRTVAPYTPMAGQTTMLPRVLQTQQEPIVNQTTPYQQSNIPSLEEIAALGQPLPPPLSPLQQMLGNVVRGTANMVAQNQQASIENPRYIAYPESQQPITVSPGTGLNVYNPVTTNYPQPITPPNEQPSQQTATPSNLTNIVDEMLQANPDAYLKENMPGAIKDVTQLPPGAFNPYKDKPASTTPEEDPFKLRPLEYATIGLKGLGLGKSIYDALQPAEKEQLRLNREAGLVNNMMAGRNVNMAAALNEALYNRNAALASNQARSANVQRALDMQTYSNTERNAIRSKLEEQNMNNQLRMQEAQIRAELGAAEAAERIRRQNVQSMNEAARRAFGQQAFADLGAIGTELNKAQIYKDMAANKKNLFENQFRESLALLKATGGKYGLFTNNADQILNKLTSGQSLTADEYDTAVKMIEAAKQ